MTNKIIFEWEFKPENFFEEDFSSSCNGFEIKFKKGIVLAEIEASHCDGNDKLREDLHKFVNDKFMGTQLFSHETYELTKPTMHQLYPDGRTAKTIFAEAFVGLASLSADIIISDTNGNILSDSKAERIHEKRLFSDLVAKHKPKNPLVEHLVDSYHNAVNDPANELVHLYEIRDALSKEFGGEGEARKQLNITKDNWSVLGKLANNEPLIQGRHRGKSMGELRDASHEELTKARNVATSMIRAYLEYIDN